MLIAVTVMIGSFRQTVNDWVSRAISGTSFFGPAVFSTAAYDQYLPPEVLPELRQDPDVADIYLYRCVRIPFKDRYILVIGGSFEVLAATEAFGSARETRRRSWRGRAGRERGRGSRVRGQGSGEDNFATSKSDYDHPGPGNRNPETVSGQVVISDR